MYILNILNLITFICDNKFGGLLNYGFVVSFASTVLLGLCYFISILKKPSLLRRTEGFETYEFGTTTIGNSSFMLINKHYYILGVLFIIFDVELMYIFPWVATINDFCSGEKCILLNFVILIMLGYSYEIASGAINWYSTSYRGHSSNLGRVYRFLIKYIIIIKQAKGVPITGRSFFSFLSYYLIYYTGKYGILIIVFAAPFNWFLNLWENCLGYLPSIYITYKICKLIFIGPFIIKIARQIKGIFLLYLNINILIICNIYLIITNWDNFLCTVKYQCVTLGLQKSLLQITLDHQLFNAWFGLDFFSLILLLVTSFITILAILSNWNSDFMHSTHLYLLLIFWIELMLFIAFSSLDLFIFFISFEGMTIPTFFIIYLYGSELTKIRAAFMFLLCSLSSSTFLTLTLITLHSHYKSSNIGNLCIKFYYTVPMNNNNLYKFYLLLDVSNFYLSVERFIFLWVILFLSFAIKLPLCPFHMWLPEAHSEAPTGGSILLAGAILKLGGFGLFKFFLPLMSSFTFYLPAVYVIILTGIYYTSIVCTRINHMKQVIAYSSVSHMGASTLGLLSNYSTCILGSLYSFIQHSIIASGFFIIINILYERNEVYEISMHSGLNQTMPYYSIACLFHMIANLPFPFFGSFIGEFFILSSIWKSNFIALFIFSINDLISAVYNIWYVHRIIFTGVTINFSLKKKIVRYVDLRYIELILIITVKHFTLTTGICSNLFLSMELV